MIVCAVATAIVVAFVFNTLRHGVGNKSFTIYIVGEFSDRVDAVNHQADAIRRRLCGGNTEEQENAKEQAFDVERRRLDLPLVRA